MERARDSLGGTQDWLGFIDSGWPEGDPKPPLPEGCFALVPVEEAAAPLVKLIREFKPHVVTTYAENGGYPHPDHIQSHNISVNDFRADHAPAPHLAPHHSPHPPQPTHPHGIPPHHPPPHPPPPP